MRIYPQDLGIKRYGALLQRRSPAVAGSDTSPNVPTRSSAEPPRFLSRLWLRDLDLTPEEASIALAVAKPRTLGPLVGLLGGSLGVLLPILIMMKEGSGDTSIAHILGTQGVVFTGFFTSLGMWVIPRREFRRLHREIAAEEIETLIAGASDDLERAFLGVVRDALRQEVPPAAEKDVRAALRALGEAIDRLPVFSSASADVTTLRQAASAAMIQAGIEADSVVAASQERRADALTRSADAAERSALLMRRSAALKEEMLAQTEALRLGLTSFYTGTTDITDLTRLAAAVQSIAVEAASVAAARNELDTVIPPVEAPQETLLELQSR